VAQSASNGRFTDNFPVQTPSRKLLTNVVPSMSVAVSVLLLACSPALDWRNTPVPGAALAALFPCKPDHFSRSVALAGQTRAVALTSCQAAGQTFAVLAMDVQQALRADEGLVLLRQSAEQNFGGKVLTLPSRAMPLASSGGQAQVVAAELQRTDGTLLRAQMMFFSRGSWVYQATVMGTSPNSEALDFFFDNLKLSP
jgi:hypothetical protein